jgi:3-hydroxyisobutyrate dehydrogenase-like beta-hydroxyacid dehydrogenase
MSVGVIGLGVMGMPIARHMMASGFEVVGYDIADQAMAAFVRIGGKAAASPREVAERSELVLTLLPSAAALHDVVDGANGLTQAARGASVVAECSTLPIAIKTSARDRLANLGVAMLDCPLSGTGAQAETRDLVVLGSGPRAAYDKCAPAFQAMSRTQRYLGEFGNGSRMKFVANHLVNIHNVAAAEAMVLGMKAGLDPRLIYDVIAESAGSSRMFQVRGRMMAEGNYSDVSMALALWRKDIETIAAFAADLQCPVPLFTAAAQPYYAALAQGLGDKDTAAVCAVFEEAARVIRSPHVDGRAASDVK